DYKYCNIDTILKKEFKSIEQKFSDSVQIDAYKLPDAISLVLLNGNYSATLSDKITEEGLHLCSLSDMPEVSKKKLCSIANVESDAFIALNTVFSANGLSIKIDKNTKLTKPIQIIQISSALSECFVNSRILIDIEEGASASIYEEQILLGESKTFTNYVSEKFIGRNAKLNSCLIQTQARFGYSVNTSQVALQADAHYDNTTITLNGQLVRNNHNVELLGENAQAHLNGLFTANDTSLIDNHTLMDHMVPHCESNELYKGIINNKGIGVFNGKILVRKDAQKTNAYQSSKNILLSDDATVNAKPQLEIYANDVKCSHGTSTGKIDENALFYLNARGIGKESAKKMLLSSFAQEVILKIESAVLQERINLLFSNQI
ncbi:MAG: Fe-S cluster assembly protein SufD, partial [Bacteroidota bacterium]